MNAHSLNIVEELTNPVSRILEMMKSPIAIMFVNKSEPASLEAIFTMREVAKTSNFIWFVYAD